jgi:hypothetical protein
MIFIVDETLGESRYETGFPSLADAAKQAGHQVFLVKYRPISQAIEGELPAFAGDEAVVIYGTINFCKLMERRYGKNYCPGLYMKDVVKFFHKFAVQYGDLILNDDYNILPFGEVRRRFNWADVNPFFIKPLSGLKEFTGQVICDQHEFDYISPHNKIFDDELCVVAAPKHIKAEFRYVIVEGRVITGSEYRWDNILDVRTDTHPTCDALANLVAANNWQPDAVYVCDIALTDSGDARIIELNAFSSSGLYACDTHKIVAAVSAAAEREFKGEVFDTA